MDYVVFLSMIAKKTFLTGNSYYKTMKSLHHQSCKGLAAISCSLKFCRLENVEEYGHFNNV